MWPRFHGSSFAFPVDTRSLRGHRIGDLDGDAIIIIMDCWELLMLESIPDCLSSLRSFLAWDEPTSDCCPVAVKRATT
ncbi:hypothetical protein DTO212C5_4971 [Paecilomyces variotii]|nr:hypothetical protein DTO212C5_4971 [Paecilomyces variotii]